MFCGCSTKQTVNSEVIVEEVIDDVSESGDTESVNSDNESDATSVENGTTESNNSTVQSETDPKTCTHIYGETVEKTAVLFSAGTKKYTCKKCGDSYEKSYPLEKIKILSIGNSYSLNSMWELYSICKQAGVKDIDIAIMYIGGCSLDQHWENVQNNSATYTLYRNNNGSWVTTDNYSIETIISEGNWDVITLQNSSGMSGRSDGFTNLDNMVNYVSGKCPDAKILWHMTWGYQSGSKWLTPSNYNGDEMIMYNSIVECAQNIVAKNNKIHSIVPVGTAVMNARTSRLKNEIHQDDGSHLSEDTGYYVGAFTWFSYLTGMSVYDVNFISLNSTLNENMDVIRESAQNALDNPYQITQSYYKN